MSTTQYQHNIGGNGVAQGLPLRRASQLYDVEPNLRYPNVLSMGTDADRHTYDRGIYLRVPHLPVTFVVEPYIQNHRGPGGNGTFTRRQYFVIKRGQPLMAATKRQPTIGVFSNAGAVSTKTYVDPAKLETKGQITGYTKGATVAYDLTTGVVGDYTPAATARITPTAWAALPAGGAGDGNEVEQDDYTASEVYNLTEWNALAVADQEGYMPVYSGQTDTNDGITTGGENQYAVIEDAIFGSTTAVKYWEIDADTFYFTAATKSQGFIYPSTGGFPRTVFFNEIDVEAGVTLPTDGTGADPRLVGALGNVTDVAVSNVANWYKTAVELPARTTIGFAHTDLEQTTSHQYHMFQTGTDVHSPVRKGMLSIPYINITKFKTMMEDATGETFNFSNLTNNRSGLKVGLDLATPTIDLQNEYSLLTSLDGGYANLYYNFAAPFLVSTGDPSIHGEVVPDLFGNYVMKGAGALAAGATDGAGNDFGVSGADVTNNIDGAQTVSDAHVCGKIINIYDMPRRGNINLLMNPIFQSRFVGKQSRNYLNEGYRRLRGADNAGLEPILSDFIFMTLGGSNYDWSAAVLPKYNGVGQDLANILEDLVLQGAFGILEIAADVL